MSLIKRELFKFFAVFAFSNASNKAFASGIVCVNGAEVLPEKNCNSFFVFSVFPDPVTPEMMIDWGISKILKFRNALSAVETSKINKSIVTLRALTVICSNF